MIDLVRYIRPLGLVAIVISITAWVLQVLQLVEICPYYETERIMIGVLGVLMVLPHYRYVSSFLTMIFGLFGIHVACAQIFMHTKEYDFADIFTVLATLALCIISAQMLILFTRALQSYLTKE